MSIKNVFIIGLVGVIISMLAVREGFRIGLLIEAKTVQRAMSFEVE
jgi:hypothetical protein